MPRTIAHGADNPGSHAAPDLSSLLDRLDQITARLSAMDILAEVAYDQGCHDTRAAIRSGRRPRSRPARTGPRPDLRLVVTG